MDSVRILKLASTHLPALNPKEDLPIPATS
jgi:hypothetical protein